MQAARTLWSVVLLAIVAAFGCKQEDLKQMAEQVKQATVKKLETVNPKPIPTGQVKLTLDQPVNIELGRAQLLVVGDGRPPVLQIRSYVDPDRETFPAIYFQGTVNATEIEKCVGQTVRGKLFVQTGSAAPIWFTAEGQTVSVVIEKLEESELVGNISGGTLISTQGKTTPATGSFRALLPVAAKPLKTAAVPTEGVQR